MRAHQSDALSNHSLQEAFINNEWDIVTKNLRFNFYAFSFNLDIIKSIVASESAPPVIRHLAYLNLIIKADLPTLKQFSKNIDLAFYDPTELFEGSDGFSYDSLFENEFDSSDLYYCSALPLAIFHKRADVFDWLWGNLSKNKNVLIMWDNHCFAAAVSTNQTAILEVLLKTYKDEQLNLPFHSIGAQLQQAILKGNIETIQLLANFEYSVKMLENFSDFDTQTYWNLLIAALCNGLKGMDILKLLLPEKGKLPFGQIVGELDDGFFPRLNGFSFRNKLAKFRIEEFHWVINTLSKRYCDAQPEKIANFIKWLNKGFYGVPFAFLFGSKAAKENLTKFFQALLSACAEKTDVPEEIDKVIELIELCSPGAGREWLARHYHFKGDAVEAYKNYLSIVQDRKADVGLCQQARYELANMIFVGEVILNSQGQLDVAATETQANLLSKGSDRQEQDAQRMTERALYAYEYLSSNPIPEATHLLNKLEAVLLGSNSVLVTVNHVWPSDMILRFFNYYRIKNPLILANEHFAQALNGFIVTAQQASLSLSFFNHPATINNQQSNIANNKRMASEADFDDSEHQDKRPRKK